MSIPLWDNIVKRKGGFCAIEGIKKEKGHFSVEIGNRLEYDAKYH